jgi:cupin fold WbuC family metalloprotein
MGNEVGGVLIIDDKLLDELSAAACASPRRRLNRNLHADYAEPCQRLLNAVEPGTYIRPHRHLTPPKPECFLAVRGRMALAVFADDGSMLRVVALVPGGPVAGVDLPAGAWHAIVALAPGSVFFETKPGPYAPLTDKDFAPWAPAEGSPGAGAYQRQLEAAVQARLAAEGPGAPLPPP